MDFLQLLNSNIMEFVLIPVSKKTDSSEVAEMKVYTVYEYLCMHMHD